MTTCDYCGVQSDARRLACHACGYPLKKPPAPKLAVADGEQGREFFALDLEGEQPLDFPRPERPKVVHPHHQQSSPAGRRAPWWRSFLRSTDHALREAVTALSPADAGGAAVDPRDPKAGKPNGSSDPLSPSMAPDSADSGGLAPARTARNRRPGSRKSWLRSLAEAMDRGPEGCGVPRHRWSAPALAEYLRQKTGIPASDSAVRRQLHRLGYVCIGPLWVRRHAPEAGTRLPAPSRPDKAASS